MQIGLIVVDEFHWQQMRRDLDEEFPVEKSPAQTLHFERASKDY